MKGVSVLVDDEGDGSSKNKELEVEEGEEEKRGGKYKSNSK